MICDGNDSLRKLWREGSFQIHQKLFGSPAQIDGSFVADKGAAGHCEAGTGFE